MKLSSLLAAVAVALLTNSAPSQAAVFSFAFTPDTTQSADIGAKGSITTDDAPVESGVIDVSGQVISDQTLVLDIAGLATGYNILDPQALEAYFSFGLTYEGIGYTFSFGPSFLAPNALTIDRDDGREFIVQGDLVIQPGSATPSVSAVPLPPAAAMFGAALAMLGGVGALSRRAGRGSQGDALGLPRSA
jgi:hypothetical protein